MRSTAALPYSVRTNFQEGAAVKIEEIDLAASGSSCPRRKWGVGCRPSAGSVNVRNQPVEQRLTLMERVQHNHVFRRLEAWAGYVAARPMKTRDQALSCKTRRIEL